ncbi:uncharacterized protein SPSK_02886 [Sporothrix schenckii 1099-18]|uniref:Uncharacterized protein n=1 Tax=Sporothrix schenckii 1099-18 TaxID=1397361 RepID=A0A0F2MAJ9_SPOSC|nr:uncharacterized protein SPSK_02886 [Sporothrix schenckii 1099-18]KJR86723.1 hypothetical protein SPSK_02886 [Sporothrix schenckii 1099-18]
MGPLSDSLVASAWATRATGIDAKASCNLGAADMVRPGPGQAQPPAVREASSLQGLSWRCGDAACEKTQGLRAQCNA